MRTPPTNPPPFPEGPEPEQADTSTSAEVDRRLEALLDELVSSRGGASLPADFTLRVLKARPYAPWEVRRLSGLRVPAMAAGGLLGGAAVLSLTPLWTLGPQTALLTWGNLVVAAFSGPIAAAAQAGPRLAEAISVASGSAVPGGAVGLGAAALLAGGAATLAFRRVRAER